MENNPDSLQIEKKIEQLRELHSDWDPSAMALIDSFDTTIAELTIEQHYADLDITRRVVNRCKLEIKKDKMRIANTPAFSRDPYEDARIRHGIFERIKVFQYFLGIFARDYRKEMSEVEATIDAELEK